MINIKFYHTSDNAPIGFKITGHSGYAQAGSDIVCAAVSSAAYLTANTVLEILKVNATVNIDDGSMEIIIPKESAEITKTTLLGLELHLNELSKQYTKNVTITTTEV